MSAELKATPGPWSYCAGKLWAAGQAILRFTQLLPFGHPEHPANCHLIAAAPDLYAALEDAIKQFSHYAPTHESWHAALVKARGEAAS